MQRGIFHFECSERTFSLHAQSRFSRRLSQALLKTYRTARRSRSSWFFSRALCSSSANALKYFGEWCAADGTDQASTLLSFSEWKAWKCFRRLISTAEIALARSASAFGLLPGSQASIQNRPASSIQRPDHSRKLAGNRVIQSSSRASKSQ